MRAKPEAAPEDGVKWYVIVGGDRFNESTTAADVNKAYDRWLAAGVTPEGIQKVETKSWGPRDIAGIYRYRMAGTGYD